jgi:hypothetical protein
MCPALHLVKRTLNHDLSVLGIWPPPLVMLVFLALLGIACEDDPEPIGAGSACQALVDCVPSANLSCRDGSCQAIACERLSSCPADAYCVRGFCGPRECDGAGDCARGVTCFEGACRDDLCESAEDCSTGSVCQGTPATCGPPPSTCTEDQACLAGTICETATGKCITPCSEDSDCDGDGHCDGRICRAPCSTSFDCSIEQVCHLSRCIQEPQCPFNCPSTKPHHQPETCTCLACLNDNDCAEDGSEDCTSSGFCRICAERSDDASFCSARGLILEDSCCVACIDDIDCGSQSLRCEKRACVRGLSGSCRSDDDCAQQEVCDVDTCRLPGSLNPCERQIDCEELEACYADGRCHQQGAACDCIDPSRCVAETGDTLGTCAGCTTSCQQEGCRDDELCFVPEGKPEGYCVDAATLPGCA